MFSTDYECIQAEAHENQIIRQIQNYQFVRERRA